MNIIEVRTANKHDSFLEIAECIYSTDPFIYPTAFGTNKHSAVLAISELVNTPGSLFFYPNILVAVGDGVICGILLYNEHGAKWCAEEYYLKIKEHLCDKEKFEYASTNYFEEESKKPKADHIEIVAVCVAAKYRKEGIASKMLSEFIAMKSNKTLELDVLSDNEAAIRLYSRHGFHITEQNKGFSINEDTRPDCYHMVRYF